MSVPDGSVEDLTERREDLVAGFEAFFQRLCQIAEVTGCFDSPTWQPVRAAAPDRPDTRR